MAISTQLAGTQPGSIKNRVGYGFKKKKNPKWIWVKFGFYKKSGSKPDPNPEPDPARLFLNYKKPPIYITVNTNPNSLIFQLMPPGSSPSLPHFSSCLLNPHPHYLTQHTASHLP